MFSRNDHSMALGVLFDNDLWAQLPGKHHDDGAPRGQQDVAERIRYCVSECRKLAPGFILNRPQRRRCRSRARAGAGAEQNNRVYIQHVASETD